MKFLTTPPPDLDLDRLRALVRDDFDLEGQIRALYSERDLNHRLTDGAGQDWLIKVFNADEGDADIACQLGALHHLAMVDPGLPVPRHRRTRDGADWAVATGPDGRGWRVCVLSYLPGRLADDETLGPADFHHFGAMIARLQRGLRGYIHPAAQDRHLLWDLRELVHLRDRTRHLGADRATAEALIDHFEAHVLPRLPALRAQVIHGDIHPHNLILGPDNRVSGLIDFGDAFHGPAILDVANALPDFSHHAPDPEAIWSALVAGFHSVQPIEIEELDLIYDLMVARQLLTQIITATRAAERPDRDDYLAEAGFGGAEALHRMTAIGRDRATAIFAAATGRSAAVVTQPVARLMERRRAVMGSRPYVFYDPPLHIVRGEGCRLFDAGGRAFLDCYNNVPIVGHCNARVTQAIAVQSRILNTNTRYLGELVLDYAERLGALTDGALTACAFVNSGSEANDIAWRMARAWTGNRGFLTQEFAYHGVTEAIDAISPSALRRGTMPDHVRTMLAPDGYRGIHRHGTPDMGERYAEDVDRAIASLDAAGMKPAAVMIDMAFMTNGVLEPVPGYVAGVFERVRKAGGLCIADEVQSGFGRMGGHFFGYMHHGVVPDFVTIGKPAGNGHPIGVVLTRPEILDHFMEQTDFFSTFGGNNVSCAAGLAVLDEIRDRDLLRTAATTGAHFKAGLLRLQERFPIIGDVRGTGLAFGVELVRDRATLEPAPDEAKRLINDLRDEGILVGGEGVHGNIIKMRPPLVFTPADADIALAAIERALVRLDMRDRDRGTAARGRLPAGSPI
ncbi:MAG: aminotransferase class III-fold pyridoxal phosphate-dependent enzyme [Rubellimicrobium sp.]|nr:aminotransferase class III-fold pyridoxal phosphate-dependent enzyme [Rubellimicrobium sp.]